MAMGASTALASSVTEIANGHGSAGPKDFETFFRAEYSIVTRIALSVVRDVHRAEDVAQEVFISAQVRFEGNYDSSDASRWVRIAASHRALNELRGERRRSGRESRDRIPSTAPEEP